MSAPTATALYDSQGLRAIEAAALAMPGMDGSELMRRAGRAAWRLALRHWPQARRIVVVCGPGNNGGDGYAFARHALDSGRDVRVFHLPEHAARTPQAQAAAADCRQHGGRIDVFNGTLPDADLVVDALFGIGRSRTPDAAAGALIDAVNAHPAPVLALDLPSGVDADRGDVPGSAVRARHTLEFIAPKAALRTGPALDCVGQLDMATLDVSPQAMRAARPVAQLQPSVAAAGLLPARSRNSHKGSNGRVLCLGGDNGQGGAILLCAEAAARCGAGVVQVGTRQGHVGAALARLPNALVMAVERAGELAEPTRLADVIALGPGLGQDLWGRLQLESALASGRPVVLDADALNLLAARPRQLSADSILTPHPGEAARLLGITARQVQSDRLGCVRRLADQLGAIVVLKGAGTVVCAPERSPRIIDAGNPGMAVAGMGDLLTGVIAALRAQGVACFEAACMGAWLHALAADAATAESGETGLLPTDLLPHLRRLASLHLRPPRK